MVVGKKAHPAVPESEAAQRTGPHTAIPDQSSPEIVIEVGNLRSSNDWAVKTLFRFRHPQGRASGTAEWNAIQGLGIARSLNVKRPECRQLRRLA